MRTTFGLIRHPARHRAMTAPDQFASQGLIAFGRIVGAHGLSGALRVRPDNPQSDPNAIGRLFVDREGSPVEHRVRSAARAGRGSLKLELDGVDTIEQAQALRGTVLYVAIEDLPPPSDKEFYYFEVVGLTVETSDGCLLGKIEEVFFNGANDVWVVRNGKGGELLIPVIDDVVRRIDREAGRVIIEPIPGLLD